jgi:hypothetical protein
MYFDYNEAIEQLENEVGGLKSLIGRTEVEIKHKNDRIEKLKETAEMYAPKKDIRLNIDISTPKDILVQDINKKIKIELEKYAWTKTTDTDATKAILHAYESVLPRDLDNK